MKDVAERIKSKLNILVQYQIDAGIIKSLVDTFVMTPLEIEEFLRVCMSLIHTPINFQGILHAESAMRTVVRKILESSNIIAKYSITMADDILCSFFESLGRRTDQKGLSHPVHVTVHPEFAFYVKAAEYSKSTTPLYIVFCSMFQTVIERISGWRIARHTQEAYIRACRYFFEFMPDETKFDRLLLNKHFSKADILSLIASVVDRYKHENKAKRSLETGDDAGENEGKRSRGPTAASRYEKMLKQLLLSNVGVSMRQPGKGTKKKGLRVTKIMLTETPDKQGKVAPGYEDSGPQEIEVCEAVISLRKAASDLPDIDDDLNEKFSRWYVLGDEISPGPDVQTVEHQRRPRLRLHIADALNLRAFIFCYDSRYPNLYHISIVIIKINELWGSASVIDRLIMLLLLILLWTGNHPEDVMLMGMHTGEKLPTRYDTHRLFIARQSNASYYLLKPALIQYKTPPTGSPNCRATTAVVKIPLPCMLTPYIQSLWDEQKGGGYFFSTVCPAVETSFALDAVREFLDKHINTRYDLSLTPHRIAAAFFPLFTARYGLDEILAYYVSSQYKTLFRSRSHYLHVSPLQLETEYLRVASVLNDKIQNNAEAVQRTRQECFPAVAIKKFTPLSSAEDVADNRVDYIGDEHGFGSAIVPTTEAVCNYVTSLHQAIKSKGWDCIIERHNLYVVYTYFCAEFNYALRPRNEPSFSFSRFAKTPFQTINDKLSCRFYEDRLVPTSGCLGILAQNYRRDFPRTLRYLASRLDPSLLDFAPEKFFFFLGKSGKPKKFLLRTWREVLAKAAIPYPFNSKSPRHYVKTYLYEHDVCDELSDAWHGHHHEAREPLGITSSLTYADMIAHGLPVIESMLAEIGFSGIPYLPED
ncbi:MAG: hypothetical protein ABSA46_11000 [Thermodesulfovibrionales bacterium]|jgi:hypothetical protein